MFDKLKMAANPCVLSHLLAAKLVIESDNFGRVRIRGALTNYYLCIKRNATLIGRKVALIAYGHFIILCAQCLQNAGYSLLWAGLNAWEYGKFALKTHPERKFNLGNSFFPNIKMLHFSVVFLPRRILNWEKMPFTHTNPKELPRLRCPDVWI